MFVFAILIYNIVQAKCSNIQLSDEGGTEQITFNECVCENKKVAHDFASVLLPFNSFKFVPFVQILLGLFCYLYL